MQKLSLKCLKFCFITYLGNPGYDARRYGETIGKWEILNETSDFAVEQ